MYLRDMELCSYRVAENVSLWFVSGLLSKNMLKYQSHVEFLTIELHRLLMIFSQLLPALLSALSGDLSRALFLKPSSIVPVEAI